MATETLQDIDKEVEQAADKLVEEFSDYLDLDIKEVAQTIQKQAEEYGLPVDEATRSYRSNLLKRDEVDESELTEETSSKPTDDDPVPVEEINHDDIDSAITVEVTPTSIADYESDAVAQLGDLGDETGAISFIAFRSSDTPEIEEGTSYRLSPVFVDTYEGDLQVKINGSTEATELSKDIDVDAEATHSGQREERTVTAPIVDTGSGSGLIKRCPEDDCTRVVSNSNGRCEDHGEVDGEFDLRIKAVLDTGDEAITAFFDAEQTAALTGIDLAEAKEIAQEQVDMSAVADQIDPQIIGRHITVTGYPFELHHGGTGISVDTFDTDTADEVTIDNPDQLIVDTRSVQANSAVEDGEEPSGDTDATPDIPDGDTDGRQPARRVFASELSEATHTFRLSEDDRAPKYVLLPTGEKANRLFFVGTLTEVEDVGNDDEYLRGRVVGPSGTFYVYAGQYQPGPAAFLRQAKAQTPMFVAVTGNPRTYETDEGDTNVSVKPEVIAEVDRAARKQWVSEAAQQTFDRIKSFDPTNDYYSHMVAQEYDTAPTDYTEAITEGLNELIES